LPAGQKEYAELARDRELAKARYDQLEMQRQRSAAQIELNRRKQGETLEELDSASLPTSPSQPKRYLIIPMGAVLGFVIGVVIVGMREMKDTSLKTLKDARLYTQLAILGSVPLLENDVVVQRRKQVMWVGWAAATIVGLAIMAGSVVHYYMSKT
jgi:G-rich domain on putative tyrosine kinase